MADTSGLAEAAAATDVGAVMPGFDLKDYDGKAHRLEQYKGKVVVLEFCSQECPWSRGADPALTELAKKYEGNGVVFLGVDSHHATTTGAIKEYAQKVKKTYPILKDEGNKYADAVGAKQTPEIYVVDKDGKLAYHGAFDNRRSPEDKGTVNYTQDAVEALLAGRDVENKRVKAWGCTIKRAK